MIINKMIMKKKYIKPQNIVIACMPIHLMDNMSAGDKDIDYGGVDDSGSLDPSARSFDFFYIEENIEEEEEDE